MSDLAPFVATVLRDRAMVDMLAEMEKLKRLVDDRLKVQITGRKGSPVYCEGSLKDGYTSHRDRCFEVMFDDDNDKDGPMDEETPSSSRRSKRSRSRNSSRYLKLSALKDMEIRLGGMVIQRLDLHTVIGSCNAPFFTDDDFYRDTKYTKPEFLAMDRKELIFKVKTRRRGPVPFVIARFGNDLDLADYRQLRQLDASALGTLAEAGFSLILDGLTFSKPEIKESLAVLHSMGHSIDEGNTHTNFVLEVDAKRQPGRKSRP